jgi:hypothetical protein
MRRLAPRLLANALDSALPAIAPATLLAQVQAAWSEVAGARLAEAAVPVPSAAGWSPWRANRACGRRNWSCSARTCSAVSRPLSEPDR